MTFKDVPVIRWPMTSWPLTSLDNQLTHQSDPNLQQREKTSHGHNVGFGAKYGEINQILINCVSPRINLCPCFQWDHKTYFVNVKEIKKNRCVVFLMHFHEAVRWIMEAWGFRNGPSIFSSSDEGEWEDDGTQSHPQPSVRARQPVRHVSNFMRHSKVTSHVRLHWGINEFYADPDEEINPNCNSWAFILLCDLNRPRQTLVGSHYPPPSPPHRLTDTHRRAVIFHPAQWASDRSRRGSASMEDRLAGLTLPYSPVNYGHLLGRPSLGAFQGPWLLP